MGEEFSKTNASTTGLCGFSRDSRGLTAVINGRPLGSLISRAVKFTRVPRKGQGARASGFHYDAVRFRGRATAVTAVSRRVEPADARDAREARRRRRRVSFGNGAAASLCMPRSKIKAPYPAAVRERASSRPSSSQKNTTRATTDEISTVRPIFLDISSSQFNCLSTVFANFILAARFYVSRTERC